MMAFAYDGRRERPRRWADEVRAWLPLIISIATTLIALGVIYGKLSGRLDLIDYRIYQIEQRAK